MRRCWLFIACLVAVGLSFTGCAGRCDDGFCPAFDGCPCPEPCPCGPECPCRQWHEQSDEPPAETHAVPVTED
jgi:hypothetical protein